MKKNLNFITTGLSELLISGSTDRAKKFLADQKSSVSEVIKYIDSGKYLKSMSGTLLGPSMRGESARELIAKRRDIIISKKNLL